MSQLESEGVVDPPEKEEATLTETPPHTIPGILSRLGPGLIVAGSIVGSGELIATTKTGAEAGFWLLWLIAVGCVIKVFVQIEMGRYTIVSGKTSLAALSEVPGPHVRGHGNWVVWYWFAMWLASIGQLGGIVGGVGQALAISIPITQAGRDFNEFVDLQKKITVKHAEAGRLETLIAGGNESLGDELAAVQAELAALTAQTDGEADAPPSGYDDVIWASIIAVGTAIVLMLGRYHFIQSFSTILVASFTFVTLVNVFLLQSNPVWAVTWPELVDGLSFRLPPDSPLALGTALAAFGIIGVGASELVVYPYWCLEKGYARFTGPRDKSPEWTHRARGWMRVMHWDAWCSMVVYTFATLAFYLLGASILGRTGLVPEKQEMVRTLGVMYEPVFGAFAPTLFLFGAIAVLYSTYFVANASHARTFSDALSVIGVASAKEQHHRRRVTILSGIFPFLCLAFYCVLKAPVAMVLVGGLMQAFMLPMLAVAALYFRYAKCDERLKPGKLWDAFLWVSAFGMGVAGFWAVWDKIAPYLYRMMG